MSAPSSVTRWAPLAQKFGRRFNIPAQTLLGLIQIESGGNPGARSPVGAQGLTQFMPGTARGYKVNVADPASSIRGAAQYLSDLGYSKDPRTALAKYNGGPGNPQYGYAKAVLGAASAYGKASYTPTAAPAPSSGAPVPQAASGLVQALQRPTGLVSPPPAPAFSAHVQTPSAYTAPPGVYPQSQQPDLRQQLAQILQADRAPTYQPSTPPVTSGTSGPAAPRIPGAGLNYGRVVVAGGANRAGVGLQKPILGFVQKVAGVAGRPIQITTGTNHNQFVAGTNRVSDHWAGNAVDIAVPVDSARGDLIASSALIAAGIPQKKAQQMAAQGGLYNLDVGGRRLQVIWKTNEGGNHHNHVHIGLR